jgi:hypothetical protein
VFSVIFNINLKCAGFSLFNNAIKILFIKKTITLPNALAAQRGPNEPQNVGDKSPLESGGKAKTP